MKEEGPSVPHRWAAGGANFFPVTAYIPQLGPKKINLKLLAPARNDREGVLPCMRNDFMHGLKLCTWLFEIFTTYRGPEGQFSLL